MTTTQSALSQPPSWRCRLGDRTLAEREAAVADLRREPDRSTG